MATAASSLVRLETLVLCAAGAGCMKLADTFKVLSRQWPWLWTALGSLIVVIDDLYDTVDDRFGEDDWLENSLQLIFKIIILLPARSF